MCSALWIKVWLTIGAIEFEIHKLMSLLKTICTKCTQMNPRLTLKRHKVQSTHHGHWPGCVEKEIRYETEYTFKVGDSGGIGDWTNNIAGRLFNWIWNNFLPETCLVVLYPCGKIEGHRKKTHNGEFLIDNKQHILIYITISITAEP